MEHEILAKLRSAMREDGLDALVAFSQDNVTYGAGFLVPSHASNRFRRAITVLAGPDFATQIVVTVEENLARERSRFSDIRAYDQFTQDPADVLADALLEAGVGSGRIGIELDFMPAQDYIRLRERLPDASFEHARDIYFTARMLKSPEEVRILEDVGVLTEQVMADVIGSLETGQTESQVSARIMNAMIAGGCQGVKIQVGSGARSGTVNCSPSDKTLDADDVVRIEILGDKNRYRSNVTRTVVLGPPTEEQERIWSVLIGARNACEAKLGPGTRVPDLWRIYLEECRAGGIEPTLRFLGHGIGQTIHEEPYITETRDITLQANVTHTMEPLYMIPGRMGFHVEDMYLITDEGHRKLTGSLVPNDELIRAG